METCFNYTSKDIAFFSSDERKWISRMRRLEKKFPDKITIIRQPEDNDGCIYCKLPVNALRVTLQATKELSPEELAVRAANLARARAAKQTNE